MYSVELDKHAQATYEANFGPVEHDDVRSVRPSMIGPYDVLAAGFPCQPFSIAGVSKKKSLGRAHGFDEATSGNLFFSIRDLVRSTRPPVVLLENVKNLISHDGGRTFLRIQGELETLKYWVSSTVIDSSHWVPQRRQRTFIVALDRRRFDGPFTFPKEPTREGPKIGAILDSAPDPKYTLTPALWAYLERYATEHRGRGNGFGRGLIVDRGAVTRTLSARYYKDGSEILLQLDGAVRPRRLTPVEAAKLMGFPNPRRVDPKRKVKPPKAPLRSFRLPVSDQQAYRQFGNSVVVPVVTFLGKAIANEIQGRMKPARGRHSARSL